MSVLNHGMLVCIVTKNKSLITLSVRQCCKNPPKKPTNRRVSVADRTINLADPKNKYCVKPVQRSLVVQQDPCKIPPRKTILPSAGSHPVPRQIRVCTAADMKPICPPKPCTCPAKKPPETLKEKLKRWALFLLKAAVAGGVVYWTIDEGFWDVGDKAMELYQTLFTNLLQIYHGEEIDVQEIKFPKSDKMLHRAKEMWNCGVVVICGFVGSAPRRLRGLVYRQQQDVCQTADEEGDEDEYCEGAGEEC